MFELKRVDVDGVHLVDDPATGRPFAIVKNLLGRRPSEGAEPVKMTDLLKALGLKSAEKPDIEGDVDLAKVVEIFGKDALAKALGVELPKAEPKIEKDKLDPEVRAYIEAMEAKQTETATVVDQLAKEHEGRIEKDRVARILKLTTAGFTVDEKATIVEVDAMEKASAVFRKKLVELGVFEVKGSAEEGGDDGTATAAVAARVRKNLGRDPIDAEEAARERLKIYNANPGLLQTVLDDEKGQRAG